MTPSIDAGKLRERLEVMELKEGPNGVWTWESVRKARGQVELNTVKKNLFSSVGIGARGAELVLRRQPLTLHQAILWGERHLFLDRCPAGGAAAPAGAGGAGGTSDLSGHTDRGHRGGGRTA